MPRHDKNATPPEKRRARKGEIVKQSRLQHTEASAAQLAALQERWKCSETAAVRRAIEESFLALKR